MKRGYIIAGLVIIIGVLIFLAIRKSKTSTGAAKEVSIEAATNRDITETVTASGKIYAEEEVKISSDVSGEIIALFVVEGQQVNKGDLLCKIQPENYEALLDQAEAQYNNAVANLKNMQASLANARARQKQAEAQAENAELAFNRAKDLYEKKTVSKAEYEQAYAAYRTAKAELEATGETIKGAEFSIEGAQATVKGAQAAIRDARSNLTRTSIYAPMSGIISLLNVEKGEKVVGTLQMSGTEIMRITNFSNMEVRIDVSENEIIKVKIGDTADVEVDAYLGRKFTGLVTKVANTSKGSSTVGLSADQSTNFIVKVRILEESYADLLESNCRPFLPGMSATVDIKTRKVLGALSVPIQAVVTRELDDSKDLTEVVFISKEGKAQMKKVITGIQDDKYIEIKSGLEENQKVITGPFDLLSKSLKNEDAVTEKVEKEKEK
jgi:HlyD family secretion protein